MSVTESKSNAWHAQDAANVLAHFRVSEKGGLSDEEVIANAKKWGKNEIPPPPSTSILALIIEQFSDLLVLILLGAAFISFILALFEDAEDRMTAFVEPAVILIILILNAVVGVVQETNAEKAIEKLKESEARDATVLRNGILSTIHAADLVPGDIIHVSVGDKVPADARIVSLQSPTLLVDESNLTGEAEAVNKQEERIDKLNAVNQDKRNMLFSGTLVVRGKATAVITSIGADTEMGAIAHDLGKNEEKTPLQEKLDEFGEQLSKVIGVICIVVWLINIGHFTDPDHGGWVRGAIYYFKIAVALAVAAIPEGLPAVVTTCLALGTMKMAKKNAIVRSLPSVETLGCTTVICSDKTGTITTNQMTVLRVMAVQSVKGSAVTFKQYRVEGDSYSPIGHIYEDGASSSSSRVALNALNDPALVEIGRISSLCNESTLGYKYNEERKQGAFTKTGAPTEAALLVLSEKIGSPDEKIHRSIETESDKQKLATGTARYWNSLYKKECTLEFDRDRKSMSVVVKGTKGDSWLLCKGAPESVLERCSHIRGASGEEAPLTPAALAAIKNQMESYALEGLRCLALASIKNPPAGQDYKNIDKFREIESRMTFVGLAAMMDPPRPAVEEAIRKCRSAGIRVIVITGDNKVTAESICRKIGLFGEGEDTKKKSFTGSELEVMTDAQKNDAVKSAVLFSRVEPKHKNELVGLLKNQGEVVAMTGDGVNDATALKKADIGIAMGSGTAVACEASKMVLQDDNFATIVMAVEEGRAIYSNTKQFIRYLISSNIGEVACIFLTAALGIPDALIPVQLLWVNLVTDGLPATALGFNPPDGDIMQRSPRGRTESIVNGWMFFRYIVIGVYVGAATVMGAIWWFLAASRGPHLSFSQLTHFHDCSKGSNPALFAGVDCEIFHNPLPSTVALSILVTIEMFNALNALSENQSLIHVTPLSNVYVLFACTLSFALHFMIIYLPFFSNIFHVGALNAEEWIMVIYISLPIFFIDETLKFISRRLMGSDRGSSEKKRN